MLSLIGLVFVIGTLSCSPIKKKDFTEVEYEVNLHETPNHRSYFIKRNELPIYEKQFAKIRELGDEINCKITGSCQGMKRGQISKKSMLDDEAQMGGGMGGDAQFQDPMMEAANSFGGMGGLGGMGGVGNMGDMGGIGNMGGMGGEDVSAAMMKGGGGSKASFMAGQKDAASYGQQPQMDLKMSSNEMAALSAGMGQASSPMGPQQEQGGPAMPDPSGGASMNQGPPKPDANDAMLKMQEQQNAQIIDNSVQDKLSFMDKANNAGGTPGGMPGMPGVMDPLNAFPHAAEGKDDTPDSAPGGVSQNDLMKAEDIQPNEMKGINSFLKDSNHMDKQPVESMINDSPNEDGGDLGKTNVDFGGSHASIDNQDSNGNEGAESTGPMSGPGKPGGPMPGPVTPGGPEVPTLMNLGLGMTPSELGPPGAPPSIGFIQDNTRHMIQQNSDYKVPQSPLSNLWNSYMSSTQSLLGEKDPSANSRQSILRPIFKSKLHRRSNVEKPKKASVISKDNNNNNKLTKSKQNFVYVPSFVIKNVLSQVKKTLKSLPKSKNLSNSKKKEPALFITEKKGKRYLVINPASPLIQGFANVDDQFASFQMPAYNPGSMFNTNGFPSFQLPAYNSPSIPFGTSGGPPPFNGMKFNGFPFLGGQTSPSGLFRGFVAVPITTRIPFSQPGFGGSFPPFPPSNPYNFSPGYHPFFNQPSFDDQDRDGRAEGFSNQRTTLGNYQGQNVHLDDDLESTNMMNNERQFSKDFGSSSFNERSDFEMPSPVRSDFERPSPSRPDFGMSSMPQPEFGMTTQSRSDFQNPSPFRSDFESPSLSRPDSGMSSMPQPDFGMTTQSRSDFQSPSPFRSDFERPSPLFNNAMSPGEGNYQNNFKRSSGGDSQPHPYVFTKDHVGFGPITVEAHTASYRGGDPKDDE